MPADGKTFCAPARVNLIGEHTDYTGGLVLPMAIPFYTNATVTARTDGKYSFQSESFPETRELLREDREPGVGDWSDYPVGVLRMLQDRHIDPPALSLRLKANVPLGAGLSSSASIEVATAIALLAAASESLGVQELARLCQRAENDYVHSPCGIMDQFVVTAAKAGHALLLNTRSLEYEHLPINEGGLAGTRIVICNSLVKHSVATGEYGSRRKEVEAGQAILVAEYPDLRDLGDATLAQLEEQSSNMSPRSLRRCRHIITENARVRDARQAMLAGDPVRLGRLMVAAHNSMRDDFEASCAEIDFLVEIATRLPGCFGARMTGGGFGGCTVNLVTEADAESFSQALKTSYRERYGIDAETYICEAVDGALRANAGELPNADLQT